jgi:hypothetical protein
VEGLIVELHAKRVVWRCVLARALIVFVAGAAASCTPAGADSGAAVGAPTPKPLAGYAPTNVCTWSNVDWDEMPPDAQTDWELLGWTQEKWDYDIRDGKETAESKSWKELTATEREAARQLGFTQATWDSDACERK